MKKCQIFTPEKYVNYMLDLAGYNENLYGKKILENSFGEGNFLVAIIDRYISDCRKHNFSDEEIMDGLSKDIYGFEIDEEVYKRCLDRIKSLLEKYGLKYKNINLFNADSLISELNDFDYVVGNPPYISYRELDVEIREATANRFESCKIGKFDYCYAFIEKSIQSLKEKGVLVYIIPSSVCKNVFANTLRKKIIEGGLEKIIDQFNEKVFSNAIISPTILKVQKGYNENIKYLNYSNGVEININRLELLDQKKWTFSNTKHHSVKCLGDEYHIGNSIATLANDIFVIKNAQKIDDKYLYFDNYKIEKELIKKAYSPHSITLKREEYIIFPYLYVNGEIHRITKEEFEKEYPFAFSYLKSKCDILNKRDSDKSALWFEYGRSQALKYMNKPKIMMSILMTNQVKTYYLEKNDIPYSGIYITVDNKNEYEKVKKILCSNDFLEYLKNIGIKSEGKSYRITCTDIKNYGLKEV